MIIGIIVAIAAIVGLGLLVLAIGSQAVLGEAREAEEARKFCR